MNASVAMANGGDAARPGPDLARNAARDAQRRLFASRGAYLALAGIYNLLWVPLFAVYGNGANWTSMAWSIGFGVVVLGGSLLIKRRRAAKGLHAQPTQERGRAWLGEPRWLYIALALLLTALLAGLAYGVLLARGIESVPKANAFAAVLLIFSAAAAINILYFVRIRYAEALILAAMLFALAVTLPIQTFPFFVHFPLVFGLGTSAAGLLLHLRWRAFVAALPKEGDA